MKKKTGAQRMERNRDAEEQYEYHLPVMLAETLDLLITDTNGIYIDGTLGGGGHAAEIIKRIHSGRLYAFDADEEAIRHSGGKFADELAKGADSRIVTVHANYAQFTEACSKEEQRGKPFSSITGLLLDLGVSSRQLDEGGRGISFRFDAPLDMRFGGSHDHDKRTAADIINNDDEEDLIRILRHYGEEPYARHIVRAILTRRRSAALETTADLRSVIEDVIIPPHRAKTLARVFQAFRIAVNRELEVLEDTLRGIVPRLHTGGRIVVITYHSLEDRIVKHVFKELTATRHATMPGETTIHAPMKMLTPKPLEPTEEEIRRNPRARSAKVRAVEKL
ncbi:MAG: 16S rRNA (cytosine(1402)-N(4))-methyltransferase RsmH [Candidatus Kapabacteria bacterium]|nr:16S rRNA (cytosine(1402)-N(4))-methyltransferase RsmH [Candidatus Kapabacteria bacterium]